MKMWQMVANETLPFEMSLMAVFKYFFCIKILSYETVWDEKGLMFAETGERGRVRYEQKANLSL